MLRSETFVDPSQPNNLLTGHTLFLVPADPNLTKFMKLVTMHSVNMINQCQIVVLHILITYNLACSHKHFPQTFCLCLCFYPDDGGSLHPQNVGKHLQDYNIKTQRPQSELSPLRKLQISNKFLFTVRNFGQY